MADVLSTEQQLRAEAERLRSALNAAQLGDWSWEYSSDLVRFGAHGAEFFGLDGDLTITWSELRERLHPDDRRRAQAAVELALAERLDYSIEYRVLRAPDEQRWIAAQGRGVYSENGTPLGMAGVVRDVTSQKQAEEVRHRLSAIVESSDDAIISKTLDGVIRTWNAGAARMFGYTEAEAVGRPVLMLIPQGREQEEEIILSKLRRGERIHHYETVRVAKDGRLVDVSLTVSPVKDDGGNIIGASKIARDISERRLAEALHDRLAAVVESSDDAIVSKTLEGIITTWNKGAERVFGYAADETVGQSILMLLPEERKSEENLILQKIRRGERIEHFETERVRKDGRRIIVSVSISPVKNSRGEIIGASKIARDITERKLAEELVRRNEAELRTLADSIPQLVWMARPDGEVFWFNERWYEYTGAAPGEINQRGWQAWVDPSQVTEVRENWLRAVEESAAYAMNIRLRGADGQYRWFLTRANAVRDETGRVLRWFGTNTNIEESKQIEAALRDETEALELINETGKAIGSTLELSELLQGVTDAATRLSGAEFGAFFYNVVDERGDSYQLYTLSGASRAAFEQFGNPRATPLFGPTFRGERTIRLADVKQDPRYGQMAPHLGMPQGHLPVSSYLAVPVRSRNGEVLGGLFFGHSSPGVFTERAERIVEGIASQASVAVDNARLYERLQRAAQEREELLEAERAARSEAERVSLMKDEFLATLSHELRTPLNAILGWSQLLAGGGNSAEDLQQGLEAIERNARAQTQLIADLLDMSRIISGKIRLDVQWIDLAGVVEAATAAVRPSADAKGVRLRTILDPLAGPVLGDPTRLQQVIWNLLTNGIKFTPKEGKVDVFLERVNSHLEITVRDTGIGIKPEFLPQVFERFRQADASTTRVYGGLGLGLSIVKHLVELHGGTVRAKSAGEGLGATFTVSLPLAPVRGGERREHPATSKAGAFDCDRLNLEGVKVLVIDDEPDARKLIERVLLQCQAEVRTAASAKEGLQMLRQLRPDVLVSDIGMPLVDGYHFIRQVRSLPESEGGKTPAIALTAFARSEDRTRAMLAGYQVHIAKPIEPQELLATVGSLAGRTGLSSSQPAI